MILRQITRTGLALVLIVSHLHLSYNFNQAWWHSAACTVLVLAMGWMIWRRRFFRIAGLQASRRTPIFITLCTVLFTLLSLAVMNWQAGESVSIVHSSFRHYIHNFFYIINEEVVFGALLLYFMHERLSLRPEVASGLLAVVVALGHLALYKWYFRDQGLLAGTAVVSLFFVAFAKNNLIIRFGHIGYAWALHFGWMVIMYGCIHLYSETGTALTDLEKFNVYLGALPVTLLTAMVATFTLMIPRQKSATLKTLRSRPSDV